MRTLILFWLESVPRLVSDTSSRLKNQFGTIPASAMATFLSLRTLITAGRAIVAVEAGARSADAAEILARHGGTYIHQEPGSDSMIESVDPVE